MHSSEHEEVLTGMSYADLIKELHEEIIRLTVENIQLKQEIKKGVSVAPETPSAET